MFVNDFVLNGQVHGPLGEALGQIRFDPYLLKPYKDGRGIPHCTMNTGKVQWNKELLTYEPVLKEFRIRDLRDAGIESPVFNAATLRKE